MTDENTPHYRDGTAAGFKGNSKATRATGRAAAEAVTETLGRRHQQMVDAWTRYGVRGAIPEEVAGDLELPVHVVRPRAGELKNRGLLFEIGKRPGLLGCDVMAYSVVRPAEQMAEAA